MECNSLSHMRRVAVLPFPGIEGAFVCLSGRKKEAGASPSVSFVYVNDNVLTEWEPEHGPLQITYKREGGEPDAMAHWIWPFASKPGLNWSHLAVDNNELPSAFAKGDYAYIFFVLKDWAGRPWEPCEPAPPAQGESK